MENVITVKYSIGETVYLITDIKQMKRLVTGYKIRITNILYLLSCGESESAHYDFEISDEENKIIKYNN